MAINRRKSILFVSAIALALSSGLAIGKEKIKIVSHSQLSGPQSIIGESIKLGAQLALEQFGQEITSQGFDLALQPEDDQATPNVGVANANRLINDPDILAVVAHYNSGVTIPASEVYAKAGLAAVTPAATNPVITDRESTRAIMNRICGRDDVQGPAGATFAVSELKVKKVYVINDKTAYGAGISKEFEKVMKEKGVTVQFSAGVDEKETDFSAIVNRALVDKPDLIYFAGIHTQGGLLIKQARQKGIKAVIMGGDGIDSSELPKIAGGENMVDVYYTTTGAPLNMLPAAKQFGIDYRKRFGKQPEVYSVYAYDAMHVAVTAIANAIKNNGGKKPSREQVAVAMRNVKINGLTSNKIEFNTHGDIKIAKYVVVKAGPLYEKNDVIKVFGVGAPHM